MSKYDQKNTGRKWPSSSSTLRKGKQKIGEYDHKNIERKWQKIWEKKKLFRATDKSAKKKFYALIEFPYPSGDGLHVGHIRSNTAMDVIARKRRMEGYNVLYPIGWDAFGLPTENYAIKTGIQPKIVTKENTDNFRRQLKALGFSFDWSREINTTDPSYYKWTQWIFLQFLKHGLAYKKKMAINWCPKDMIGLANEEVVDGCCERCGTPVEKREKDQWMLAITKYADRLDKDLDTVDFLERIKIQQRNWIGKKDGMIFTASVKNTDLKVETFSAHFEAFCADTFVVVAPDHPRLKELTYGIKNQSEILAFADNLVKKRIARGQEEEKEPEGIFTGRYVVDPVGNGDLPIWVASYALADYGTGIVKCSAHDERDFKFAMKYGIRLKPVLFPNDPDQAKKVSNLEVCFTDMKKGVLTLPKDFNGRVAGEVRSEIIKYLEKNNLAKAVQTYKLRDWIFSRQRYWGEPIPVVFCESCAKRRQKVLLLHGFEGSPEGNWFPWIKRELEKRGFEVFVPALPNSAHPKVSEWVAAIKPILKNFGKHDIVIGHSLGSQAAIQAIQITKKKIGTLFLIASALGKRSDPDWEWFRKEWAGSDIDALKKFWQAKIDFSLISRLVGRAVAIFSADDPYVKVETAKFLPKDWQVEIWDNCGHFDAKEVPEILKLIESAKLTGWIPVPEKDLPVKLPEVKNYRPTDSGESPLATISKWVNVKCPKCKGKAKRETDTMPNWAGSSWYYIAYCINENLKSKISISKQFPSSKIQNKLGYWCNAPLPTASNQLPVTSYQLPAGPVDWYNGGMEHTTLHLLYSRFWHKFLFDLGLVPTCEPYAKRTSHGLILAEGGEKMSKSKGNVINPDTIVETVGADALRLYEMFMGPFDQAINWSEDGVVGTRRFLERVWKLFDKLEARNPKSETNSKFEIRNSKLEQLVHQTIKKVSEDIEAMKFNTAVSALMILLNAFEKEEVVSRKDYETLLLLLSPFAPHISEELWVMLGNKKAITLEQWPTFDPVNLEFRSFPIAVQVNGKTRGELIISRGVPKEELEKLAKAVPALSKWLENKNIVKVIHVPDRLLNFVVRDTV